MSRDTTHLSTERERLAAVAQQHQPLDLDRDLLDRYAGELAAWFRGDSCLDVGSRGGCQTEHVVRHFPTVVAIDAVEEHLVELRRRFPQIRTAVSLIEEYETEERFDCAIMIGFLEHVIDPVGVLRKCRSLLKPGGRVMIGVPNARSLHRHIGVAMGMLPRCDALTENDDKIGHRRVYSWDTLRTDIVAAGLTVRHMWGGFLKPLSSGQMARQFTPEQIDAFYEVGRQFPDLCNFILAVAEHPDT